MSHKADVALEDFAYSGTAVLENLKEAVNYNVAVAELVVQSLPISSDARVLDFGAGVGTFAGLLRDKGVNVECLEVDRDEQDVLLSDGYQVHHNLNDLSDKMYDAIYSLNVLEHIEDDCAILQKLRLKLKPGGTLFIFVPAFQLLYTDFDKRVGHHRRYALAGLRKIAVDAGYGIEQIRYFDSVGFAAALIFKLLGGNPNAVTPTKIRFFDRIAFPLNTITDPLCSRLFGKNIYMVCRRENTVK